MERSGAYRGKYHVLHGKLSPIRGVGPEKLNIESLRAKVEGNKVREVILALGNDMEGEATWLPEGSGHRESADPGIENGFGWPSGGNGFCR